MPSKPTLSTQSNYTIVPNDILNLIFSSLNDAGDLARCGRVNKSWHAVANTEALWKSLWERVYQWMPFPFGHPVRDPVRLRLDTKFLQYFDWMDDEKGNPYKLKCIQKYASYYIKKKWAAIHPILWPSYPFDEDRPMSMKAVFVGRNTVGKTSFLMALSDGAPINEDMDMPIMYEDNPGFVVTWRNIPFIIGLWDTFVQEEYDRLRPLSYPQTDFFCICFSVVNPYSFGDLETWVHEVTHHCPGTPYVLVGTKVDLREDEKTIENLRNRNLSPISYEQGLQRSKEIGAAAYIETSSKRGFQLIDVLEAGINAFLKHAIEEYEKKHKKKKCAVM